MGNIGPTVKTGTEPAPIKAPAFPKIQPTMPEIYEPAPERELVPVRRR